MTPKGLILFLIGAVLGASIVLGVSLTFEGEKVAEPITVSDNFCSRALGSLGAKWRMDLSQQVGTVGKRDNLTSCSARTPNGNAQATVTVLALGEDANQSADDRIDTALDFACSEIGPVDDQSCTGPVTGGVGDVGQASAFTTSRDGAVVTVIFTAPSVNMAAVADDVLNMSRTLGRESMLSE